MSGEINCVLHGSFRKNYNKILETAEILKWAGVNILAPNLSPIIGEKSGFAILADDRTTNPVETELLYLQHLKHLGQNGFSYFVNPDNVLGTSASYELGISQMLGHRFLFTNEIEDHPVFIPNNSIWQPEQLADYIKKYQSVPHPIITKEQLIAYSLERRLTHSSEIAVGGIIQNLGKKYKKGQEPEILLVQTHKWGGKFSLVGGRVRRNENQIDGVLREMFEQTKLKGGVGSKVCSFDKLDSKDYHIPKTRRRYIDYLINVNNLNVQLNDEAESHIWMPPSTALRELDVEPNAKFAVKQYMAGDDYKKQMAG